ncbi:response regulator PleD [Posidoniimonas polymericola]|uniref:Response regulator PleD n=1 Tax=Posidoniimonas polymericola TaxID=2528002 RepID=A0A5C5Y0G6_9BACT|nr:response regulator [Posidoniimonas polymericola]TWT67735.1 response regulator PleD [Posidoniimonas polymericola]
MSTPCRILIVDESPESREVLRALLERGGSETLEADRPDQALRLSSASQPDLIVCDVDSDRTTDHQASRLLVAAAVRMDAPIVFLGALKQQSAWTSGGEFVAKPYHYGPLIRRIESLLANRRAA